MLKLLKDGLAKTRETITQKIGRLIGIGPDEDALERAEELLIQADVGVRVAGELIDRVREAGGRGDEALRALKEEMVRILGENRPLALTHKPFVIMVVGVNGVGKTTTIGKLAARYASSGKRVILAAGDTFRAAAIEQLEIWARRTGSDIVKHRDGADAAAVVYDAISAARSRGHDVVIADTAGRLHTKVNLMEELKKIKRVAGRALEGSPHEVLLVLDATIGQNALSQVRLFHEAVGVTGIALAKLDGTAKGGIVLAVRDSFDIPIRLIGVGEDVEDLRDFDAEEFVSALFAP
ncbi:MAG: signal recognition particle-docking protein FtsY [bacterium]